ncbi:putative F-box protein At3g52320 [Silene latifolia]|uniref:putative F-box protein At3g52320 n=1 Tax=Silene latifolia TaxID=37657 RepID=UPI003D77B03E
MKNTMNWIPPELLFEVLTHLPAKDLLKLRVVCKLWNSIICDPSFHQHHLHQLHKNNIHGCEYYISSSSSSYLFRSVDIKSSETLATIEEIKLCKSHYDGGMNSIMGCVDGVLLARTVSRHGKNYVNVIFLWNPTLRKVVDIPLCGPLKKVCNDVRFGFGFDSVSNIYKVVAIYWKKNGLKIIVYNLGSRSWTSPKMDNVKHLPYSRTLNFEGCIYWHSKTEITSNKDADYYLCFNLSTEALTCAKLPDRKCDEYLSIRRLAVLYESLAIVDDSGDEGSRRHIHVWMRRKDNTTSSEFSWVMLYNLDCYAKYFVYLANNGNLYLQEWSIPNTASVYDLKAGKEKVYSENNGYIKFMEGYLGSLALLT